MFDQVEKNKTAVQIVLAMVSLGLVVGFGLSGYSAFQQDESFLAKVGGTTITERDVAEAVNNQNISNEMKPAVVEQLIQQRLLSEEATNLRFNIDAASLREFIATIPEFQVAGKFDATRYKQILEQQRMTPGNFEQKITQNLIMRQLIGGVAGAGIVSLSTQERMEKLLGERRELQFAVVPAQEFVSKVTVSENEIKEYYDSHASEFKLPEQVKLEYVVLSRDELAASEVVSDQEVEKYFQEHKQEFDKEERKARHILLVFPSNATPEQKLAVREQGETLLADLRKDGNRFADLAKQKSQDPGSAAQGGDLGWFGRGMMVKSFEDTVFSLEKNQVSSLVESEYGYHIIKLEDVRHKTLAEVKPEIVARLKQQKVQSNFQLQSEKFNEIVYQQADSLKPAADELKLTIQKSAWLGHEGGKEKELANAKIAEAVFSDDVLKSKHNSEAIEVSPGVLVAARVIEHKPEQVSPLADAHDKISSKLHEEKALKQAMDDGAARLKKLNAGESVDLKWSQSQEVVRVGNQQIPEEQLKEIFRVAPDKLPGYVGSELKGVGYLLFKVAKVSPAAAMTPEARQRMTETLTQMYGQVAVNAYVDSLRKQIKVEYKAAPKAE